MTTKSVYVCQNCGYESKKWEGKCSKCNEWNTYEEVVTTSQLGKKKTTKTYDKKILTSIKTENIKRIKTNIDEFDRVLSGGFVPGQVVLMSGNPGIGKSTLLIQIADKINKKVLYISGEESSEQIALRANRLGIDSSNISLVSSSNINELLNESGYDLVIIDSIQAMGTGELKSQIGSISQIRECSSILVEYAKTNQIPVIVVAHITKEGNISGPKLLEHIVDTVLFFEGDNTHFYRLLKVNKNRFGDVAEVGVFEMNEKGLVEVKNPVEYFINGSDNLKNVGRVLSMVAEGNRPLAIEIQALTVKTSFGFPRRACSGFSLNRLNLLCAVVQKVLKIDLTNQDVYLNVVSGFSIKDPAADLAVCAAIMSSFKNQNIIENAIFYGEIGLTGEVRKVKLQERRNKQAKSLGFIKICSSDSLVNISGLNRYLLNK